MTKEEAAMVRDLMVTLEYLRAACELSEGKRKMDNIFLTRGMNAGIGTLQRYKHLILDYQRKTYWDDVWEVGDRLVGGVPLEDEQSEVDLKPPEGYLTNPRTVASMASEDRHVG